MRVVISCSKANQSTNDKSNQRQTQRRDVFGWLCTAPILQPRALPFSCTSPLSNSSIFAACFPSA